MQQQVLSHIRAERGVASVWTAVAMLAFIIVIGIGVDFAGHASMSQDARAVADEAARTGGQRIQVVSGHAKVDVQGAVSAARAYVKASAYSGSAHVLGGTVIEVRVFGEYQCQFLSIIGIDTLPVKATGAADLTSVVSGKRR